MKTLNNYINEWKNEETIVQLISSSKDEKHFISTVCNMLQQVLDGIDKYNDDSDIPNNIVELYNDIDTKLKNIRK